MNSKKKRIEELEDLLVFARHDQNVEKSIKIIKELNKIKSTKVRKGSK